MRPDELWLWSITVLGAHRAGINTNGRTKTFEDAKAELEVNYDRWSVHRK